MLPVSYATRIVSYPYRNKNKIMSSYKSIRNLYIRSISTLHILMPCMIVSYLFKYNTSSISSSPSPFAKVSKAISLAISSIAPGKWGGDGFSQINNCSMFSYKIFLKNNFKFIILFTFSSFGLEYIHWFLIVIIISRTNRKINGVL